MNTHNISTLSGTTNQASLATQANGTTMLTGLFNDRESAERAYNSITARGYDTDDVNLVMSDDTRKKYFQSDSTVTTELGSKATAGAGIGSAVGGALGAAAAAIVAIGTTIAVPGLGLLIAGPAAAAVAGLGAGGLAGGVVGALIGLGIPEERVEHYQAGIDGGGILLGVTPRSDDDATYFEQEWKNNNGVHVYR